MVRGPRRPHFWGRVGVKVLLCIFILASVASSINYSAVLAELGGGSLSSVPNTPDANQAAMNKAGASQAGQTLKKEGYSSQSVISDTHITDWLNDELKNANVSNPGPYVIFSTGAPEAVNPSSNTPPDVVVDATNQVIVGLYQTFSDHVSGGPSGNGRGAICYTSGDPRALSAVWATINASPSMWNASLDEPVMLSRATMPQLPSGMDRLACYIFVS